MTHTTHYGTKLGKNALKLPARAEVIIQTSYTENPASRAEITVPAWILDTIHLKSATITMQQVKEQLEELFDSSPRKNITRTQQVRELYDSLSDEQKRTYALGVWSLDEEQRSETTTKICQLFCSPYFGDDLRGNSLQFIELLSGDFRKHLLRMTSGLKNEEATAQITNYFESLSDQQKTALAEDILGEDEKKRNKALQSLWKFDGDLMENTKLLAILSKKHMIEIRSLPHVQEAYKHLKDKGEKNEREYLAAESERINDVVRRHKELHPPRMKECPVCLDDIEMTEHNSMIHFYCCGQGTCYACFKKNNESGGALFSSQCPFCRGNIDMNNSTVTRAKNMKRLAEKGSSFAQYKMAIYCFEGCEEAHIRGGKNYIEWLQLASENSFPDLDAMVGLAEAYTVGTAVERGVKLFSVEKSKEKAVALLKKAADMGSRSAQDSVAIDLWDNADKNDDVRADAVYYATLGICERPTFIHYGAAMQSALVLGCAFHYGQGGMETNPYLARHYFNFKIAVQGNMNGFVRMNNFQGGFERAYCRYGEALIKLGLEMYGDISVPGFSPIPKALYWLHKTGAAMRCEGCSNPHCWRESWKRAIDMIKAEESKKCSYCSKKAEDCPGGKLKSCAKCSGAWYCSRDCQVAAWKAGHKRDCVSKDAPKEAALH